MNQTDKTTIGGSICGPKATWQPWNYSQWIQVAEKVAKFKAMLKDPNGKQRPEVIKLITKKKSRQEFVPSLGKYVDLAKAEPLHKTNHAWQHWFLALLRVAMQYSDNAKMKPASVVSHLPSSSPLVAFLKCIRETVKCARLCNSLKRWFSEKSKKGISFSYKFTGSKGLGQNYFTANRLLLDGANPTVWTVAYAIPYHTSQLFETLGFGLGLNSMQGREAKQVKLAKYVKHTSNVKNSMRWSIVFRHEFVCLIWLREMDPYKCNLLSRERERERS